MELRLLRYFLAVAEELHFGRAAQRLHIEQPPLSQQIRKLERELGVELFERTNRVVRLTEAGRIFEERAQHVLVEADIAADMARRAARGEVGSLRIGYVNTAVFGLLPAALRAFRARWPEVALSLHEAASADQVQAIAERRLDIGLVRPPFPEPAGPLACRVVDREPLVACLPADHPLAVDETVALASLAGDGFIWFPRNVGAGLYGALFRTCQEAGFVPTVAYEASEIHGIVGLVAAGLGVALVPRSMQAVSLTGAVYRSLVGAATNIPLGACWRDGDKSATLAHFLELFPEQ